MKIIQESENISILILDDDRVIRAVLNDILTRDYIIKEAESIKEFNEIIENFTPHIILLDLILPDGYGLDLCKTLREDKKFSETAILLMTSKSDKETIESGYSLGADDFIRKPIIPYEIHSKIKINERIIRTKNTLKNTNQQQEKQIEKLYNFSHLIQKILETHDIDNSISIPETLQKIVFSDYMELVIPDEGSFKSVTTKGNAETAIPFLQIKDKLNIKIDSKNKIQYFNIEKQDTVIYCALITITMNKAFYGYLLLERKELFHSDDKEILSLSLDFYSLVNERNQIEKVIRKKNEEYRSEITKIRNIQVTTMPHFDTIEYYDIASSYLPAQELSGDFIDAFEIDETTYQIVLCDVCGHGLASSYIGNEFRTLFRLLSQPGKSPSEIVSIVNKTTARNLKGLYYYCTAIVCQINLKDNSITYVNAGHPPAIIYRSGTKKSEKIGQTGSLVGIFEDQEFKESIIELNDGDCLFLYTDGINEARNSDDSENSGLFGLDRLISVIEENNVYSPTDILHFIISTVYEFTDYTDQEDDMTAICIKIRDRKNQ